MSTTSRIFLSPPFVGAAERAAVRRAFDSGYVAPCGPQVDEFERRVARLAGRKYAVAVSSGTAALDLLMAELGVDARWLVLAPTLTFVATVGPAAHRGAELAFVDCDASGNVDVGLLGDALASARASEPDRPVLVLGVDLYGVCCDYDALSRLCRRHRAVFLCDSAEAVGATYKGRPSGSAGLAAVYSFNGNKIVTTSGGGAIVTDSARLAARAKRRAQQSREPVAWYEHREVGYNYRLSNILGALGLAQLDRLPEIMRRRAATARWYASRLKGRADATLMAPASGANHWLNVLVLDSGKARDALLARFAEADIEARPVWKPMHMQPVFAGCRVFGGEVAETLFARGVCLPSGTALTAADRARIAKILAK